MLLNTFHVEISLILGMLGLFIFELKRVHHCIQFFTISHESLRYMHLTFLEHIQYQAKYNCYL